ncbi:hypothetical protein OU994_18235 [Pseudoduganella sp. SL102]|nr:hypothetical protein [Pseudoduganella sp. SL102]WBS00261.1 hypothetical protein OU994_18235 [Pseudoduganella sp. SL102]
MIRIFNHYVSRTGFILLLFEMFILHAAASATALLWSGSPRGTADASMTGMLFALVNVFAMSALGLYQQQLREDLRGAMARIPPAFLVGFVLMSALMEVMPAVDLGHAASLAFVLGGACVLMTRLLLFTSAQSDILVERLILIGAGALARECLELAAMRDGPRRFEVVGCVPMPDEERCVPVAKVLKPGESLLTLARRHGANELVISVGDRRNGAYPVRELLDCALGGVRVTDAAAFFEREASQIRVDSLQPS